MHECFQGMIIIRYHHDFIQTEQDTEDSNIIHNHIRNINSLIFGHIEVVKRHDL